MFIETALLTLLALGVLIILALLSARFPFAFTMIIIVINEQFFGLLPSKFGGYDLVRMVAGPALLLLAIIIQIVFRQGRFRIGLKNCEDSYFPVVLAIIGVVVFSTLWGGIFIYKQSLMMLIFQPALFFYYFLYVYLCFFSPGKTQILRFFRYFVATALIVSALMAIDGYVLHEAHLFTYANVSERLGFVRIIVFVTGLVWAYYYSLASADEKKYTSRKKFLFGLAAFLLLVSILFVQLDRQVIFSCLLTTAVVTFSMEALRRFFLVVGLFLSLSLSTLLAVNPNYNFDNTFLGSMVSLTRAEAQLKRSGIGIRLEAMDFFYNHFKNTYGLGFGVLGSRREYRNPVSLGLEHGYNLNDLSLAGIIFRFGIPGLLVIIATVRKMFRDTSSILKKSSDPDIRSITRGIRYTIIYFIIVFPLTTFLFYGEKAVYFALMFFLVERIRNIVSEEALEVKV